MHHEVSETENIRYNLGIEKMIVEGCECLLDANQVFIREGERRYLDFRFKFCHFEQWRTRLKIQIF